MELNPSKDSCKVKLFLLPYLHKIIPPDPPPPLLQKMSPFNFTFPPLPQPFVGKPAFDVSNTFFAGFGMWVFFTNLTLLGFLVRFTCFILSKRQFLVVSLCKGALLVLEFLKVQLLDLCFLLYTLMVLQILLNVSMSMRI